MDNVKLQTALFEIGKDVDKMKVTPWLSDIEKEYELLMKAMATNDNLAIRKHGRRLAALTTKYMIDKL